MQPQRRISGVANDTIYFCPQEQSERGGVQPSKMPDVTVTLPGTLPSGSHKTVAWHCQKLGVRVGTMQPQRRISGVPNDTIYFCPQEQSERGGGAAKQHA